MLFLDRIIRNASFLVDNPMVIKRLTRNYLLKICLHKFPLRTVDICFDYICNFSCKHCYTTEFIDKNRRAMDIFDIKKAVNLCLGEGVFHFNLIGGEPTMDTRLFDVIDYIHIHGALISLATNGSLLTPGYVRKLKNHKLDLALISLDYSDAAKEDELRGKGFFGKAMAAVENCLSAGVKVYISAVITKDEIEGDSFRQLVNFCKEKNILLHVNLPALFGGWKGRNDLFFSEEDKNKARKLFKNKYIRSCEMSSYFSSACRSGLEKLHITAYGDVLPCTFIPISFGNILEEDLGVIRKRIFKFPFIAMHNEMCIPATNVSYNHFFKTYVFGKKKLPLKIDEINGFC